MQFFKAILIAYTFLFSSKDSNERTDNDENIDYFDEYGSMVDSGGGGGVSNWVLNQALHQPKNLSISRLMRVANMANETQLKEILGPILVPRVAGTPGNAAVRKHITDRLGNLPGWHIESHSFIGHPPNPYPFREVNFTNIIATHNIGAARRLVLACHHDSKYYNNPNRVFIGATDSAVPCAMLIHLAENLHSYIEARSQDFSELTIQLLFFDGEEAFVRWTSTDSIYGSRKLAERMGNTEHPQAINKEKEIEAIDVFVLLDLIGERNPIFHNYFDATSKLFARMQRIENKLSSLYLLESYDKNKAYFSGGTYHSRIEDDHIPFLNRGVDILHLITSPFPRVWHTFDDNEANLHYPTIMNLQKIVQAFVAEYMHLSV